MSFPTVICWFNGFKCELYFHTIKAAISGGEMFARMTGDLLLMQKTAKK